MLSVKKALVLILLPIVTISCASVYTAKPSSLITHTSLGYHRDGEYYRRGFGSGTVKVTEPNPKAHRLAKKSRNKTLTMLLTTLGGATMGVVGAQQYKGNKSLGISLLSVGALTYIAGLIVGIQGQREEVAAVQMYNDAILKRDAPHLLK